MAKTETVSLQGLVRAAIYLRASTELQNYSIANQAMALNRYAVDHGYAVVRAYEDDGRSGLDLSGRPGLQQLLRDVCGPVCGFDVLLVYDVSRWGRFQDVDEGAHYEFQCRNAGLKVVYCAEPFENDSTPMTHVMKAIKRAMAAEYSRELSEKVRRGKRRLAAAGFAQNKPGYGLRRLLVDDQGNPRGLLGDGQRKAVQSDHVRVVSGPPKELVVVRKIFRLFGHMGLSYADIVKHLNDRGVRNATGDPWRAGHIRTVLTNEAYIGILIYGRRTCRLKKISATPPQEWIRYEKALPPIVPLKLFELVRRRRFRIKKARTDDFYLKPLEALFKREGYLSDALIKAEPDMPTPDAYRWRFKGLNNAYRLVGYDSPYTRFIQSPKLRGKALDREGMLEKLSTVLDRAGYLTRDLIDSEPGMATFRQYEWAFGDLKTAYRLIGYVPQRAGPNHPRSALPATTTRSF